MSEKNEEIGMLDMVEDGGSSVSSVELPSGLIDDLGVKHTVVMLNEMTGREEDILSSKKMSSVQKTTTIIENCVEKIGTIDKTNPRFKHYLKSLCLSDRLFLLIQIRMLSLGKFLDFRVTCPNPDCEKTSNQSVDLNEFKIEGILNQSWEGVLPKSKKKYKCHVQTGYDEEDQEKTKNNTNDTLSLLIMTRLKEINGKPVKLEDLKALPIADRNFIRNEIKKYEGKIDNEIEIECPHCKYEFKDEIDIGSPSFFFP